MGVIYGHVETINDIRKIAQKIRQDIRKARSRARLTELVRRARYLVTLTYAPAWKKHFGKKITQARKIAYSEYLKCAELANKIARKLGYVTHYGPKS
jgi:hypothetical protein